MLLSAILLCFRERLRTCCSASCKVPCFECGNAFRQLCLNSPEVYMSLNTMAIIDRRSCTPVQHVSLEGRRDVIVSFAARSVIISILDHNSHSQVMCSLRSFFKASALIRSRRRINLLPCTHRRVKTTCYILHRMRVLAGISANTEESFNLARHATAFAVLW